MQAAIESACEGIPLDEVESLTLDSKVKIPCITGLDTAVCLEELSMVSCGVQSLEGFPALPVLMSLELSDNRISGGLKALAGLSKLTELNLGGNKIASLDELNDIKHLPLLQIDLEGNPCADESEEYRIKVFEMFPQLMLLDRKDREGDEVEEDSDEDEDEALLSEDDDDSADDEETDDDDAVDDDEPIELSDDDEEEEESDDDDDEPGLAALVGAPLDDDEGDEGFEATSDPESEDFDDEEATDDDAPEGKKARTE